MGNARREQFRSVVLCYHAVSSTWDHPLAVPPTAFELQLRKLLSWRYRPVPVEELVTGRARTLHVTFDDAFRSVQSVVPLLERLRVPVTVFACPNLADVGRAFPVSERGVASGGDSRELATMTWDELLELQERGVTVGSHTLSHQHLLRLADSDLARELRESKDAIETRLGRPCRFLSYPYGEHDARVRSAARAAGYEAAFALPGSHRPVDVFALPRIGVWRGEGLVRVAVKTSIARPSSPILQWARSRR